MTDPARPPSVFAALGMGREQVGAASADGLGGPGTAVLGVLEQPGGDPLAGISYQLDYTAEEEMGAGALCVAISGDPRRYRMTGAARAHIGVVSGACALVICAKPLPPRQMRWGDPLPAGSADYAEHYDRLVDLTRGLHLHGTMAELRQMARRLGIGPGRLRKDALADAIRRHPDAERVAERPDRWPAWFADGGTLALRADSGPCAIVLERLREAAAAGTLGLTTHDVPFGGGLFVYDTADETPHLVAERKARFAWHDARMADLAPVAARLAARGHRWFFLGRPTELTRDGVRAVRYWLNGTGNGPDGRPLGRQPYGWYTLAELEAERFIDDARGRAAAAG